MIAVSIFATVITIVSSLYIQTYKETARAASQNQFYDDARFVLKLIADEIHAGAIDYDEYYNRYVMSAHKTDGSLTSIYHDYLDSYGQGFGAYYSAFFNPGSDQKLGFDCNNGHDRNKKDCTPLKKTLDIDTGENPFSGKKLAMTPPDEDAFCGAVSYSVDGNPAGGTAGTAKGLCATDKRKFIKLEGDRAQLFLIDAEGKQKTILARERIDGGSTVTANSEYALSILRLKGVDTNGDNLSDNFVCADDFQCRGGRTLDVADVEESAPMIDGLCGMTDAQATDLPRRDELALDHSDGAVCDTALDGFAKDFVPISPLNVNVKKLEFYISPTEDPFYAFAEYDVRSQQRVTIVLTIEPRANFGSAADFKELTLVETVSPRILDRVPAPVLER
jgi:hypothetical protein